MVILLGLVSLFTDVSSEMVHAVLPLFLAGVLGAEYLVIGLIEGAAEMCASGARVLSGWYSDRKGVRRPFLLAGYGPGALLKPMLAFATTWWHAGILRVIERSGKGIRGPPRDAMLADSSVRSVWGGAFGLHRAMDTAGALLGAVLAFLLVVGLASTDEGNIRTVFLLSGIPAAAAVVTLLFVRGRERRAPPAEGIRTSVRSLPLKVKLFLMVSGLLSFGTANVGFTLVRGSGLGMSVADILLMYVLFNLVYCLSAYPLGRASDRVGRGRILTLGFVLGGCVQVMLALATPLLMLPIFLLNGLFLGMTDGLQKAFVADLAPERTRGTAIGLHHAVVGVSVLLGGILVGALWDLFGAFPAFTLSAVAALSGSALFGWMLTSWRSS